MKIEINTKTKTIVILEEVKLEELSSFLQDMLPNGEWKNYSIVSNTIYNKLFPTTPTITPSQRDLLRPPYVVGDPPYQYPNDPLKVWYCTGTDPYNMGNDLDINLVSNTNKADERNIPNLTPDGSKLF